MAEGSCRDIAQNRQRRVVGHGHGDLQVAGQRVAGQRIAGIALGGHRQLVEAKPARLRHHHRHAAILEALGRVGAVTRMRAAFFLQRQRQACGLGNRMLAVIEQRRVAFTQWHQMAGVGRVVGIQRQQRTEAPHVRPLRRVPLLLGLFRAQALQVEHHFNRPAIAGVEVHRYIGGVFDARGDAAQVTEVGHDFSR
jgi:hypothetical protein